MSEKNKKSVNRAVVYSFLVKFITENGYPPSVREICNGVGVKSPSIVFDILKGLDSLGLIHVEPNKPRAIRINGYEFRKIET